MTSQLVGSSFANGALLPNYVNGRLLAAEDQRKRQQQPEHGFDPAQPLAARASAANHLAPLHA